MSFVQQSIAYSLFSRWMLVGINDLTDLIVSAVKAGSGSLRAG